ncbi:hypothetical protein PHMEG_00017009 [Phytophthora megakarya]|uniref:Retrotransposon gag domain-containing protein n=1 Tax=Phytophthora megakarya TaxID=4795 RepID=A0A225VXW1_9STRA|nr:hypothetical protein PHMEG_00017009 [Phytophthora megakarya]
MRIAVDISSTGTSGETEVVIPVVLETTVIPAIGVRVVARTRFPSSDKAEVYLRGVIDELVFKGAEISGRGTWTDRELYSIFDNKLRDTAAQWWVDMDRRQREQQRTWTNLKIALLSCYGEKLDKSAAEWRVGRRVMMPCETPADFATGLRSVVGRNRVRERVLLGQFYRCLDKTTQKLVRQEPKPQTLEDAVKKATDIDDPMDNVAIGMINIGQAYPVGS